MKKHAKFSASGAFRWLSCSGSVQLTEKAPPPRESTYAAEGTTAHLALEKMLHAGPKRIGTIFHDKTFSVEMLKHAENAAITIWGEMPHGAELLIEHKVSLEFVHPEMFGTLDAAIVEPFGVLKVIDFKYGFGLVSPVENPQLMYYALGIAYQFDFNFETVELIIIQPRAEGGGVARWSCSVDELRTWAVVFKQGVEKALAFDPPLSQGKWCKYCPAAVICPELSTNAIAQARIDFGPLMPISKPDASTLVVDSERELGRALQAAEKLEIWISELREYAFHQLKTGKPVSGFKLVEKRATRKWNNEDEIKSAAMKAFGEEAFTMELKSPAQLEKVAGKEWVNHHCSKVSSGLTMVEENDSRQAINSLISDFQNVPVAR